MTKLPVLAIDRHRMRTDGKGITTLVALAGCPLSCPYCINSELLKDDKRIEYLTQQELVERLAIDHCYFLYTGGGVTFGGGEALLHSREIAAFAEVCPKEWNITIETSLNVPTEKVQPLLNGRFSFIIDVKAMQPDIYLRYTGMKNEQVIRNLQLLCTQLSAQNYVVKVPLIPGYSEKGDVLESKKKLLELGMEEENILTLVYHTS